MKYPFASRLIAEIAPSMGITVELEPEFQFAGELVFPNGNRHLFRNTNFNVNPAGSTEIAKDKAYTNYFLRKHGFHVPNGKAFFSERLNQNLPAGRRRGTNEAMAFAESLGLPVFIKPNDLSQGIFVTKVYTSSSIPPVAQSIFARTDILLVEEACPGRDYRVVILGESIISAYERMPLSVCGDGERTIDQLLTTAQKNLECLGRPNSDIDPTDSRIDLKLSQLGLNRTSILPECQKAFLLDNANLSTGGDSIDVTDSIHPTFAKLAVKAATTLGLRLAGVDILCDDLSTDAATQTWNMIEVNAAPGLDNYSSLGPEQLERVKGLYRQILLYLANHGV
jgi:D-alanine-D-alanine ligase-like ATP-grasp enzyme